MTAQILAAVIFVGMFALIIMDKFERQYVTLGSAALVLVVVFGICMHSWDAIKNALNLGAIFRADFWYGASESASSGVNWSTIFFITGMMIMVEGLGKSGFFRWLCLSLAKLAHYHVVPLLLCFMAMSAFLAMFIDSITVVLFLATVTLELAQILCFDPVPMILSEVFCANLGGAATMCGDPPNLIIGTAMAELTSFPSIPVKVTLDEYIEISKYYSTPGSSTFINGVLDKIVDSLTAEGRIKKAGRGLI